MSKFQIILLFVFGFFIIAAVLLFSFAKGGGNKQNMRVVVWGSLPSYDFSQVNNIIRNQSDLEITYVEKRPETLQNEVTEAIAEGVGPDIVILPLENLWSERNKLYPIPTDQRNFQNTFIEEGELFLTAGGVYALPFMVDPMVLYYNRDLLSREGLASPLSYWDLIYEEAAKLTKRDPAGNITQSTIALGEARNIPNAKYILSLLMLQAGTPITAIQGEELVPLINANFSGASVPGEAALDFYTQFSNPFKPFYSWNRSKLSAETNFISGDAAYYLGFASELRTLRAKNPTLNLGVALVPQSRVSERSITFGRLYGLAIVRSTRNYEGALMALSQLVFPESIKLISELQLLPPVRRDLLTTRPTDPVMSVFYDAALQSRGWLDPNPKGTQVVFSEMIESVTSGRARTYEALNRASEELSKLTK
jgi:ABC-type glycerol-3-phosphate transport system substrate-binding protein